ncbi:MAG TPA: TetR family transcriptional regulator [Jiangellales bacterium]|nr:TetR family transcriptional regulator [Jiangellales bacterium]
MSPTATRGPRRRGPGRRPGAPDTRGEILVAARSEFAEKGFEATSVRGIAARAGVDSALVHHYFGTKEKVFVAAMELTVDPAEIAGRMADGPADELAERVVRTFLSVWGNPTSRAPFLALLRSAIGHETAAALLRQFVTAIVLARIRPAVDGPDVDLRLELMASHLVGLAVIRYVVRAEPLASASDEQVVALVAPVLQRYLTP